MTEPKRPSPPWKPAAKRDESDAQRVQKAQEAMLHDIYAYHVVTALTTALASNEEAWARYLDVEEYVPEEDRRGRLVLDLLAPTGLIPLLGSLALLRHNLTETLTPDASDEAVKTQEDRDEAAYDRMERDLGHLAAFLGMR